MKIKENRQMVNNNERSTIGETEGEGEGEG